jgi:hypothetical protein
VHAAARSLEFEGERSALVVVMVMVVIFRELISAVVGRGFVREHTVDTLSR